MPISFYVFGFGILIISLVRIRGWISKKNHNAIKSRKKIAEGGQACVFKIKYYSGEVYAEKLINISHFNEDEISRLQSELQLFR